MPSTNEKVSQPVGLGVELGVGQSALLKDQGDCLRAAFDLGLEQGRQRGMWDLASRVVPVDQNLPAFLLLQDVNVSDPLSGIGTGSLQQTHQATADCLNAVRVRTDLDGIGNAGAGVLPAPPSGSADNEWHRAPRRW